MQMVQAIQVLRFHLLELEKVRIGLYCYGLTLDLIKCSLIYLPLHFSFFHVW